jgi:hypothetical protein
MLIDGMDNPSVLWVQEWRQYSIDRRNPETLPAATTAEGAAGS